VPLVKQMLEVPLELSALPELIHQPTSDDFRAEDFSLSATYEPVLDVKARMVF
jgi:hypothetical protein